MQNDLDFCATFDVDYYYVNNNQEDDPTGCPNLIHKEKCPNFKRTPKSLYLGLFTDGRDAMREARKIHPETAEWCPECCIECIEVESAKLNTA